MKRILILGGNGMLGHKLVQVLGRRCEVYSTIRSSLADVSRFEIFDKEKTIADIDVTDFALLKNVIRDVDPEVVVNAVGVIKQVADSRDGEQMHLINSELPKKLAAFSDDLGFRSIGISTDCVFSGARGNYVESDIADASDAYGTSKLAGEVTCDNCLTIRTSIIGRELSTSHSLIEWFLSNRNGKAGGFVNAIYSGFPTIVFADILAELINKHPDLNGLFHVSSDPINKFDLLQIVNQAYAARVDLTPDTSFVIDRSLDSTKFRQATGFLPDPWAQMIEKMAADPTPYEEFRKQ